MNAIRTNPIRTVTLGIVALLAAVLAFGLANSGNQSPAQEHEIAIEQLGTSLAHVTLRPEVGDVTVRAATNDEGLLLGGTIATRRGEELRQHVTTDASERNVALQSHTGMGIHVNARGPSWDLALARDVPVSLRIGTDISELDLDLRGTRVETLDVRNDVGRSRVFLPSVDVSGSLSTDIGDVVLFVPKNANATITVRRGISRVRADDAFTRDGRSWRLADTGTGTGPTIDVRIANTVGMVTLATY